LLASITGRLIEVDDAGVVVEAYGIGYRLFATSRTLSTLHIGEDVRLSVKQIFRENEVSLFGFLSPDERRLFVLLFSTNGLVP
jgi:Holliday junction DNA helicase RuvA